ncbi:hypothetical protein TrVE_jg10618 [Triparma verrucosa]|uniref:Aldose 1-epimerase n=1 Tax=Triparma verrucosa TaxID=1606542 RepID=A0A9W7CBM5_9STRA|nr:hypothetical protein TrVE_jg10618 [Triparma verrucosa]
MYLYIEEALYLMSRKLLVVNLGKDYHPGGSDKIATEKDLYSLLSPSGVSLMVYLTYSHLRSSTFIVLRHASSSFYGKNRSRDTTVPITEDEKLNLPKLPSLVTSIPEDGSSLYLDCNDIPTNDHVAFDVYPPTSCFAKSNPGSTRFGVVVTPFTARRIGGGFGSGLTFDYLNDLIRLEDDLKLSVVSEGGSVMIYSVDGFEVKRVEERKVKKRKRSLKFIKLVNDDAEVRISEIGASIMSIKIKSGDKITEGVLGFKDAEDYSKNECYFGATCGRVCNRIEGGTLKFEGVERELVKNNGPNHLHGGTPGWSHKLWSVKSQSSTSVVLSLLSPENDSNYPGSLLATCTYTLTGSTVSITLTAKADGDVSTPVNMTNHTYFNISESQNGILDHTVKVNSNKYLEVDEDSIPTGRVLGEGADSGYEVGMKLNDEVTFRECITSMLEEGGKDVEKALERRDGCEGNLGIDHNYIVGEGGREFKEVAKVWSNDGESCIKSLTVRSDCPGVQVYTGNWIDNVKGREVYKQWEGVCFEAQYFPDSIGEKGERWKKWGGATLVLKKGEEYRQRIEYEFEINND